jgi:hypothetical protein
MVKASNSSQTCTFLLKTYVEQISMNIVLPVVTVRLAVVVAVDLEIVVVGRC